MYHHIRLNADGTSTAPVQLPNAERKRRITETWQTHLERFPSQAKRPVIAHRLIFSMSKEQHDALVAVGINPDHVLHSSLKKVMRKFAERFHSGDSISSLTDCITTRRTFTPISRFVRARREAATSDAARALQPANTKSKWTSSSPGSREIISGGALRSPREIEHAISHRIDADKTAFAPRLNAAHLEALRNAQTAEAIRLQQSYRSIRNLESAIAANEFLRKT